MPTTDEIVQLNQNYQALLTQQKTLLLATASLTAEPEISYAPFVRAPNGNFYIYLSELAQHTMNLLNNPQASVLFIREEAQSTNIFARERIIFTCSVQEIAKTDALYHEQLQVMQDNFGSVMQVLATLNDFHLFSLNIVNGRYIVGFGKAYNINVANNTLANIIQGK